MNQVIREVKQYVCKEKDQQVTVLENVKDPTDIEVVQGGGALEQEVTPGVKRKMPVQFPFPSGVTLEDAFENHTKYMMQYVTQMNEQAKEANRIVDPQGRPAGGPIAFDPNAK